jgi:transcriptional regulator GlxA family with amidase domain
MRKVVLIIYEDVVQSSVSSVIDLLNAANQLAEGLQKPQPFKIELASPRIKNVSVDRYTQFLSSTTLGEIRDADLIIVPPFNGSPDVVMKKHKEIADWIRTYVKKTEWASLCLGAYFLADAGLLGNRKATSHWKVINDLKSKYDNIEFVPDQIITDDNGIYTSGGAFSSLNLIIYIIEKFCGREWAIAIAKDFSIDIDRNSQMHFSIFKGQRRHVDDAIHKAQDYIEQNFLHALTVEKVADHCSMSKRNFIRRFIQATGLTPLEYIQHLKIEVAKKALEGTNDPVTSVMYNSGYNDSNTFRDVFKKISGLTPKAYQKKIQPCDNQPIKVITRGSIRRPLRLVSTRGFSFHPLGKLHFLTILEK